MAYKEDVLVRLEKGLTPNQIAAELGCHPAYVRATRARAFGNGAEVEHRYYFRNRKERMAKSAAWTKRRKAEDPEYAERIKAYDRDYNQRRKLKSPF